MTNGARFPSTTVIVEVAALLVLFAGLVTGWTTLQGQVAQLQRDQTRMESDIEKWRTEFLKSEIYKANLETMNERLNRLNERLTEVRTSIRRFQ